LDNDTTCSLAALFAHEIGHALGFWHVDIEGSMMFPRVRGSNITDAPTEIERRHATIAYKRLPGNLDIDVDP
jgi:predicted Zn-dependent protease